jgi:hypothetical protein
LFFVLMGLLGAAVLVLLYKNLVNWRPKPETALSEEARVTPSQATARVLVRVGETDVQRLLERAKAFASQGHFAEATNHVYAALLRHLDYAGLLHLHASKTNGDYVRALREQPAWRDALKTCARDVEQIQFGTASPTQTSFSALLSRVEPLVMRGFGILVLLLVLLPSAACSEGAKERPKPPHWGPLADHSAAGFASFVKLLEKKQVKVLNHTGSIRALSSAIGALVIYDRTSLKPEEWQLLQDWVSRGHMLVVAGDESGTKHFGAVRGEPCTRSQLVFDPEYHGWRRKDAQPYADPPSLLAVAFTQTLKLETTFAGQSLLSCDKGTVVAVKTVGDGRVLLLPDADLFSNAALAVEDNALVWVSLFPDAPAEIHFAGGLTGAGADSPYEVMRKAGLWWLLLQLGLLLLVFYWFRGASFGTLRDPPERGRRAFREHILGLGRLLHRARASGYALGLYSSWALERLHERIRPGTRMSIIELSSALARRTGRKQSEVLRILADAASARDAGQGQSHEDLEVLRALETLMLEAGGIR